MHGTSLRLVAATMALLWASFAIAGTNAWTLQGPPGGRFVSLTRSSTDPNVLYGVFSRSFVKSVDAGTTWTTARDFNGQINAIAVDPTNAARVYVGVYDEGLFRTDDGGATFTQIASDLSIWGVGAAADGNTIYYSSSNGNFHRSSNRGQSWALQSTGNVTITRILVDPASADIVSALKGDRFMRSTNGGVNWTEIQIDSMTVLSGVNLEQVSASVFFAPTSTALYRSMDAGASWSSVLGGTHYSVALDSSTSTLYTGGLGISRLWRGTMPGDLSTWQTFGSGTVDDVRAIVIAGTNNRLVIASTQGVRLSDDGGQTWRDADRQPTASAVVLAAGTGSPSRVYAYQAGDYDGMFSTSGEAPWTRINLRGAQALVGSIPQTFGQSIPSVKPGDPQTVYLATFSNGLFRSSNGGATWSRVGSMLTAYTISAFAYDPSDPNIMFAQVRTFAATAPAALYRSVDAGENWTPISTNLPTNLFGRQLLIDPTNAQRMYLAVASFLGTPGLYRSVDGGVTWEVTAFSGQDVRSLAIDPTEPTRIYAATSSGFHVSTNGGTTFSAVPAFAAAAGDSPWSIALDPRIHSTIYATSVALNPNIATTRSSVILRSVDRGTTWNVLRGADARPTWSATQLLLDPVTPNLLYVSTGLRGVATFELANDLSVEITGHSGTRTVGNPSSFDVLVTDLGPHAATRAELTITIPQGLSAVSATPSSGSCGVDGVTIRCTTPSVFMGAAWNVRVSYTAPNPGAVAVTASVGAYERDTNAVNNTSQASANAEVAPPPAPRSGGGGGSFDWLLVVLLVLVATQLRQCHHSRHIGRSPSTP